MIPNTVLAAVTHWATPLWAAIPSPSFNSLSLGPLRFNLYGLMIALGVVAAVEIARRRWEAMGQRGEDIAELAMWAVPAGLIGSRVYHVVTDWKMYQGRWGDAFKIWEGGLGIPGGLVFGVGVGLWYAHRRGWSLDDLSDAVIPGIPVAQAIGRLGNWFNQEVFGRPSDLPWALRIDPENRPAEYADATTFHPTFLYEGLYNLALAAVLIRLHRRGLGRSGLVLPLWIAGYGLGRFLVESIRIDTASLIFGVRVNHWVSAIAVIGGLSWFLIARARRGTDAAARSDDRVSSEERVERGLTDDDVVIDTAEVIGDDDETVAERRATGEMDPSGSRPDEDLD